MITDSLISSCRAVLSDCADVDVPVNDVKTILESNPGLVSDLNEFYTFEPGKEFIYFDTADREWLMDCFAKFIGADHWPMYGETGTEYEAKFNTLYNSYKEKVN